MEVNFNSFANNIFKKINSKKANAQQYSQKSSIEHSNLAPINFNQLYNIQKPDFIKLGIEKTPVGDEFHIYQLKTGQKIAIAKNSSTPIIYSRLNRGSTQETTEDCGISHLLEHSFFHGSEKYPNDFLKELENASVVSHNASTWTNMIDFQYNLASKNPQSLLKAIDMQADMLFNPTFSNFESEKNIVKNEAKEYEIKENEILYNSAMKALYNLQNIKIGDIIAGNEKTINSITLQDLKNYHQIHFKPENITTVIISDLNPDDLIHSVSKSFLQASSKKTTENQPLKKLTPINSMQRVDYISKENTEKIVNFYFAIPKAQLGQQRTALQSMLEILYNRFSFKYSILDTNSDFLTICLESTSKDGNENENDIYNRLQTALKQIALSPPEEDELTMTKNQMLNYILDNLNSNLDKAFFVAEEIQNNQNSKIKNSENEINSLTKLDISNATSYLNLNQCVMSVMHPKNTTKEDIQENYKNSIGNITVPVLPKFRQKIDITNCLNAVNIEQNSNQTIKTTTLLDNTNLILKNSNTDKCKATWELYNPNMKDTNPAISYVLSELITVNALDAHSKDLNNIQTEVIHDLNKITISATSPSQFFANSIFNLRKEFDLYLTEKALETAKERALTVIKTLDCSASTKRLEELYGPSYCFDPEKLEKELEKITLNDIRKYIDNILSNSYSTMIIQAPFNSKPDLVNEVASSAYIPNYSFRKRDENIFNNNYRQNLESKCYISENEVKQPTYEKAYTFKISGNPIDTIKFNILNSVLNARLFDDLREKQNLCYTPFSYYNNIDNTGEIELSVTSALTDKESIKKIIDGLNKSTDKLKRENITQRELEIAKDKLKIDISEIFNNNNIEKTLNEYNKTPIGIYGLENIMAEIDKITTDDIRIAANYAFKEKPDFIITGNQEVLENNKDLFEKLGRIIK